MSLCPTLAVFRVFAFSTRQQRAADVCQSGICFSVCSQKEDTFLAWTCAQHLTIGEKVDYHFFVLFECVCFCYLRCVLYCVFSFHRSELIKDLLGPEVLQKEYFPLLRALIERTVRNRNATVALVSLSMGGPG